MAEREAAARALFAFLEDEHGFTLARVDELDDGELRLMYKNRSRGLACAISTAPHFADASAGLLDRGGRLRPFDRDGFDLRHWWAVAEGRPERVVEKLQRHIAALEARNG